MGLGRSPDVHQLLPWGGFGLPLRPVLANRVSFERRPKVRSTPDQGPEIGYVRFLGLEVRSTSDSRRRWAWSAETGCDPKATYGR